MAIGYHFKSLHSRDVNEGDSGEVQDEAVDIHPGDLDVVWKISLPVHPELKVLDVSWQVWCLNLQGFEYNVFLLGEKAMYSNFRTEQNSKGS